MLGGTLSYHNRLLLTMVLDRVVYYHIPYLFTRYIRELLSELELTHIGCHVDNMVVDVLAYVDDLVLLAPSWRAMQRLIDVLYVESAKVDMLCNAQKSVAMIFNPRNRDKIVETVELHSADTAAWCILGVTDRYPVWSRSTPCFNKYLCEGSISGVSCPSGRW